MELTDKHFIDWESETFGFGYGSGEQYTIPAIKLFFQTCPEKGCYSYEQLEKTLGTTVAWLLINIFCKYGVDIIEYGTSPRGGWLTSKGILLKTYMENKTDDELYNITSVTEDYTYCGADRCNCDLQSKKGESCNPLFR